MMRLAEGMKSCVTMCLGSMLYVYGCADDANEESSTQISNTQLEAIPEGCEFLAEAGASARCVAPEERCIQAANEDTERSHILMLDRYRRDQNGDNVRYSEDELEQRTACVFDWLSALGLQPASFPLDGSVLAWAVWSELEGVLSSQAIDAYEPTCNDDCDYCWELAEDECRGDAFCAAFEGRRVDLSDECLGEDEFSGCAPGNTTCGDVVSIATDATGACWWFSSGCSGQGYSTPDEDCGETSWPLCRE